MRPTNYVVEVRTADFPAHSERDRSVGKFWITRVCIDDIVSEKLLNQIVGEKIVSFLKAEI